MKNRKKMLAMLLVFTIFFTIIMPQTFAQEAPVIEEPVIEEPVIEAPVIAIQAIEEEAPVATPLHTPHVGASSQDFQVENDCGGLTDSVVWHFILTPPGGNPNNSGSSQITPEITVVFANAGTKTVMGSQAGQGAIHFYVGTPDHDTIVSATALSSGAGRLVLSHVCLSNYKETFKHISPILECVADNGDGTYTANWGYANYNSMTVDATSSFFTGNVLDTSTPPLTNFLPGRQENVFSTLFDGENLVWTLTGPDGTTNTATASKNSTPCKKDQEKISPVLECVEDLGDGTYRAWFGYNSLNTVPVDALTSKFTGGGTLGETTTPQLTNFLPGRHVKVFSTIFDGSNLTWSLKGPDGKNRTSTASKDSKKCSPDVQIIPLTVESICSGETGLLSKWVITNNNDFDVTFNWKLIDDPSQNGVHTATPGITEIVTTMVLGAANTFEMTINGEVIASTDRFCYKDLQLTALCTLDPENVLNWRITNPNPYSVEVTWKILDSELMGVITVAGNSSATFSTNPISSEESGNIAIISVNGKVQNTGEGVLASFELCPTTPPGGGGGGTPPTEDEPVDTPGDDTPTPPQETINLPDLGIPALPSEDVLLEEVIEFEEEPAPALPNTGGTSSTIFILVGMMLIFAGTMISRRREI